MTASQTWSQPCQPNQKVHLLDLPAELREAIFTFALVQLTPIKIGYANDPVSSKHISSLLQLSRQIHNETHSIFWSLNTFQACTSSTSKTVLRTLSPETLAAITHWEATDGGNLTGTAVFATTAYHRMRMLLNGLHGEFIPLGMRSEVLKVPIEVHGEAGVQWVSMDGMKMLEPKIVNGDWTVVRRTGGSARDGRGEEQISQWAV